MLYRTVAHPLLASASRPLDRSPSSSMTLRARAASRRKHPHPRAIFPSDHRSAQLHSYIRTFVLRGLGRRPDKRRCRYTGTRRLGDSALSTSCVQMSWSDREGLGKGIAVRSRASVAQSSWIGCDLRTMWLPRRSRTDEGSIEGARLCWELEACEGSIQDRWTASYFAIGCG
jgi:hypothetical protein